jgi:hypothetical protein
MKGRGQKRPILLENKDMIFSMKSNGFSYKQISEELYKNTSTSINPTTINRFFLKEK